MHVERFELLVDVMKRVRPENFSMSQWCGSAACAIGHLASDPRSELKISEHGFPDYNNTIGFFAVADYLEISYDDAIKLFHPCQYKRPTLPNVKRRITIYRRDHAAG